MPVVVELSKSEIINEDDEDVPLFDQFQRWASAAYLIENTVVASLQILGLEEMQTLNRDYSGKNKPTNVLSFPIQLPEQVNINLLGDVALCSQVINAEADQQKKSREEHWAHMVVHGMLHLQGYDHMEEGEAAQMEALEIQILQKLGYENPYLTKP